MTAAAAAAGAPARAGLRAVFRAVFAVAEWRALWVSFALSAAGDRLALVAMTLLMYDCTRSPLLAAVAYASCTVPYATGGLLAAGLADRLSRRAVMIACDVIRAALTSVMLWPGLPLPLLITLLYLVTAFQPPFDAARSAATRDILDARRYVHGLAVMQMTYRMLTIAGAAAGGLTAALVGPRPALAGADAGPGAAPGQ